MSVYTSVTQLVGGTPLLEVRNMEQRHGLKARLLVKLESMNPGGSAKDRVGLAMIETAEREGRLAPGGTIIEPTSGNTGIGLAMVAAARGYKLVLTMPETISLERRKLLAALGAELVLTPGAGGMQAAVEEAERLHAATPGSIVAGQFVNPANPAAHYAATGPEIWADTEGQVDAFVAGAGTGGTVTGVGRYLKEQNPAVQVIAVEPAASPLLSEGRSGPHGLRGIGANFVPEVLDQSLLDAICPVTEEEAYAAARELAACEGVLVGITGGAALHAAILWAERPENAGRTVVALLPDTGDRYLSTPLFG